MHTLWFPPRLLLLCSRRRSAAGERRSACFEHRSVLFGAPAIFSKTACFWKLTDIIVRDRPPKRIDRTKYFVSRTNNLHARCFAHFSHSPSRMDGWHRSMAAAKPPQLLDRRRGVLPAPRLPPGRGGDRLAGRLAAVPGPPPLPRRGRRGRGGAAGGVASWGPRRRRWRRWRQCRCAQD